MEYVEEIEETEDEWTGDEVWVPDENYSPDNDDDPIDDGYVAPPEVKY